jgi:hypothetical protein
VPGLGGSSQRFLSSVTPVNASPLSPAVEKVVVGPGLPFKVQVATVLELSELHSILPVKRYGLSFVMVT